MDAEMVPRKTTFLYEQEVFVSQHATSCMHSKARQGEALTVNTAHIVHHTNSWGHGDLPLQF